MTDKELVEFLQQQINEKHAAMDRIIAERNALARHIERLIAPATRDEQMALFNGYTNAKPGQHSLLVMGKLFDEIIAERQRKGQFAALS